MSKRGMVMVAAALTAFVLVVAGGIVGRLAKPQAQSGRPAATAVAATPRKPAPRVRVRPAVQSWHDDEHEDEHDDD